MFDERALWLSVPFAELVTAVVAVVLLINSNKHECDLTTAESTATLPSIETRSLIITISREFGSGGHEIGQELAEKLGILVYDKEVPEFTAVQTGLSSELIHETEDRNIYPFGLYTKGHYSQIHGALLRMNRSIQSEGAFGEIKWNRSYTRARRRGLDGLIFEISLIACGFNLHKFHLKKAAKKCCLIFKHTFIF